MATLAAISNSNYLSTSAWLQHTHPTFERLFGAFLKSGALSLAEIAAGDQINLYEAIEVVLACNHLLHHWQAIMGTPRPATPHIHVLCDNTSAIAWLTKYKHKHPLIGYKNFATSE